MPIRTALNEKRVRRYSAIFQHIKDETEVPSTTTVTVLEAAAWLASAGAEQLQCLAVIWGAIPIR
eukprot:14740270-Alexandrium_andersonii.AAC.1